MRNGNDSRANRPRASTPLDDFCDSDVRAAAMAANWLIGKPRCYFGACVRTGSQLSRGLMVLQQIGVLRVEANGFSETHEHFLVSRVRGR